jgi:hypothetical protein
VNEALQRKTLRTCGPASRILDMGFGEGPQPQTAGQCRTELLILNRIAHNLLKQDGSSKRGIKGKCLKAAWNHPYLLKLLGI